MMLFMRFYSALAAAASSIPIVALARHKFDIATTLADEQQEATSTSGSRKRRTTVAAAKRAALKAKRRKAHKRNCR